MDIMEIPYVICSDGKTYTVSAAVVFDEKLNGLSLIALYADHYPISDTTIKELIIPSMYNDYPIKSIRNSAFTLRTDMFLGFDIYAIGTKYSPIEKLRLPNTVERIESETFYDTHIYNVVWPENCNTICASCFEKSSIESIVLHPNIRRIEDKAFKESNLKEIDLSKMILSDIGNNTFPDFTNVRLPYYMG